MAKGIYCLLILVLLPAFSGCQTVKGAATGFSQDVQNSTNPDENGWNVLKKIDAWQQENFW